MIGDPFQFDEKTHTYTWFGVKVPGISFILKSTGFVDTTWFTDEHRDRGHAVHRAAELLMFGELDWSTVHESILPRVKGFETWFHKIKPKVLMCEKPLYSNVHGFAGTPDMVVDVNGEMWIPDVKSGKSGLAAKIQTAAQGILVAENMGMGCPIFKRFALELPADGGFKMVPHEDRGDRVMFLNALAMVNRRVNEKELSL